MDRLAGNKRSFDTGGVGLRDSPEVFAGASAALGLSVHTKREDLETLSSEENSEVRKPGVTDSTSDIPSRIKN
jgi:hypothetical protein